MSDFLFGVLEGLAISLTLLFMLLYALSALVIARQKKTIARLVQPQKIVIELKFEGLTVSNPTPQQAPINPASRN